jgi:hypothetical protein
MKIVGLVVCGMILGMLASFAVRPTPVQAQAQSAYPVVARGVDVSYIRIEKINTATPINVGSRTVVGFSCVPNGVRGTEAECFVASR